jgi:dihydrofolate synthase/folylpolyglutamate synthase
MLHIHILSLSSYFPFSLSFSYFCGLFSFFEAITALAFAAFAEHPIDVGVIEVGMGGEWDATNVVQAGVSVITPIGLDHTEYLGNTITEIAQTKGGILKPGGFGVFAQQVPDAAIELLRKAAEVGIDVAREGVEYSLASRAVAVGGQLISVSGLNESFDDIFLPLHGKHQAANAATALVAVEAFFGDTALDHDAVRAGFAAVTSPGRCEVVHRDPTILLDAAHNPHGAKALAETITNEFTFDEVIGVVASFGDKDVRGILLELEPIMNEIIVTSNSSPRAMKLSDLEKLANEIFGKDRVTAIETLSAAIDQAIKDAKRPLSDDSVGVLITGSVITVGESRAIINGKYKK